jgi:hypothetical protein
LESLSYYFKIMSEKFDSKFGGFGTVRFRFLFPPLLPKFLPTFTKAPKFPRPVELHGLLHFWLSAKDSKEGKQALEMVEVTLEKMFKGMRGRAEGLGRGWMEGRRGRGEEGKKGRREEGKRGRGEEGKKGRGEEGKRGREEEGKRGRAEEGKRKRGRAEEERREERKRGRGAEGWRDRGLGKTTRESNRSRRSA